MAVKARSVKLADAVAQYLQWCKTAGDMSPNTMEGKQYSLRCLIDSMTARYATGHIWLSQVDAGACAAAFSDENGPVLLRRSLNGKPKKASSINQIRADWKAFFMFCRENGWLPPGDPLILVPRRRVERREDWLYLSAEEIEDVVTLDRFAPHKMVMAFMVYGGCRISEAQVVRYEDLLVEDGYFRTRVTKVKRVTMKPITEELAGYLDWYLPELAKVNGRPLAPRDALCPAIWYKHTAGDGTAFGRGCAYSIPDPEKTMVTGSIVVKKALERLGYNRDGEASHVLRRSGARLLYDILSAQGIPAAEVLAAVMAFLAHSEPRTTLKYIGREPGRAALTKAIKGRSMYGRKPASGGTVLDLRAAREARHHG